MKNIVILISGSGSNMAAIADACRAQNWEQSPGARVSLVISNRPEAKGLDLARQRGIASVALDHRGFATREAFDAELARHVDAEQPVLVVLAGFMRILSPGFVQRFADRLINIHPSLLPAFPGLHTHERAIQAGCRISGATVHRVTVELDHGPILGQTAVPLLPGDSAAMLAARVLAQEHLLYPKVVLELLRQA